MSPKSRKILFNIILILATVVIFSYLVVFVTKSYKMENFTNLLPGNYPCTVDTIPLEGWYTANNDMTASSESVDKLYKNYPVYPANSTEINNKQFWENPDNGKCTPSDFCNNFYKDMNVPNVEPVKPPSGTGKRVNYYNSGIE